MASWHRDCSNAPFPLIPLRPPPHGHGRLVFHRTLKLNDNQAAALLAAGRLLQSTAWPGGAHRIERQAGETYPQAVARSIAALSALDRDYLRELVAWVLNYQRHDSRQAEQAEGAPNIRPCL